MLMFDFHSIDAHFAFDDDAPLRLRDLIAGLGSGALSASLVLDRLDPDLADEIHAVVAHRGQSAESFLAKALAGFALDAADEAWRRLSERAQPADGDAEARAFEQVLSEALRRAMARDLRIGAAHHAAPHATLGRRVG